MLLVTWWCQCVDLWHSYWYTSPWCTSRNLCMWHLRSIFVVGKYMIITCDVDIAVSFVLAHLCKKCWFYMHGQLNGCVMHICNVAAIFAHWHIKCVHSDIHVCMYVYMDIYLHTTYIQSYIHTHILMQVCLQTYNKHIMLLHLCYILIWQGIMQATRSIRNWSLQTNVIN